ncbi:hypothetical protein CU313_06895 [Prochlorococcus marinus str. MU1404]|uniref:methyltransferase domain-containing protein n=1 Tax=Prochlorococcus marinus TaxID=1219 RepID=UPI001ADA3EB3|nr:methyltransferase domain-containing protein [Prochlorococcus marinus]MBO8230549.1 class I SAM-dependent methyltransferase [Prochlorococcus marinus XMU1404]MBW3073595.1 hypothetical protein [Prochlorococcus marinus str. MU1404]MCR8545118.1 class I SAM-dependent methyltransferase [Prochlorococcus marinus CUG1432]
MSIRRVKKASEFYEDLASRINKGQFKNTDILNGRGKSTGLTQKRIKFVIKNIKNYKNHYKSIVDFGCGDGSFLSELVEFSDNLTGLLPSNSEVNLTRKNLKTKDLNKKIEIVKGLTTSSNLKSNNIDFIICNSVLHLNGFTLEIVEKSLRNFSKLQKNSGTLYIGELPEIEENFYKREKSIIRKIQYFYKGKNFLKATILYFYHLFIRIFSKRIFYTPTEDMFYMSINDFENLLNKYGYKVIKIYDSNTNKVIRNKDKENIELRRLDYLCKKVS